MNDEQASKLRAALKSAKAGVDAALVVSRGIDVSSSSGRHVLASIVEGGSAAVAQSSNVTIELAAAQSYLQSAINHAIEATTQRT